MRRLLLSAGGGSSFHPSVPLDVSGPYDPALTVNEAVLTQVHCHTTNSDGSFSPAVVVNDYLTAGYGALILTDHDKATGQPAGITTAIVGNEHSPTSQHIIAMNSDYLRGGTTDAQTIIDAVVADGGECQIAHPKWYRGMTYAELAALDDYLGFEIHNAKCVNGSGQNPITYPGFAVDLWDQVLTGASRSRWGFSVDDLHSRSAYNTHDVGRLYVFVDANDTSGIMSRLGSGNFVADVANLGVTPGFPDRSDTGVSLSCTGATRVEMWGSSGLLAAADTNSLDYAFTGSEHYVRPVVWGDYTEAFVGPTLPAHWRLLDGTWEVDNGLRLTTSTATFRRYILWRPREGDFTALWKGRVGSGAGEGMGLMFNVLNSSYFYMIRFGKSTVAAYHNQLTIYRSTADSTPRAAYPFTHTPGTLYDVRVAYTASTGLIQAKIWEDGTSEPVDWQVEASDTTWRHGAFGVRSNYSAGLEYLYIDGFKMYYQPMSIG